MDHLGLSVWLSILYFFILGISIITLLLNLKWLKRLDQFPPADRWPKVSVLVPARNEEKNIRACVQSLLFQDYPDYEVIVLDDESTDNTGNILAQMCEQFLHLKVLKGKHLPAGWMGKNWACHQLAEASKGELILFTDADTIHHPRTLREAVSSLTAQNADLLTAIPYEKLDSWGEKILLPYFFFTCLAFLPIDIAHRLKNPVLCFSIGQFMFFKRSSYLRIGGHKLIKGIIMEDLTLGRSIKKAGLRWRMVDGGLRIQCRMYHSFSETWKGLSRFLYLGYDNGILQLLAVWVWTSLAFLGPISVLVLRATGDIHDLSFVSIGIALFLDLALWAVAYWRLRFPIFLSFFFPITFLLNLAATLYSVFLTVTGRTTWKGRPLIKTEV
jgi:chlorobactene glucosyltransferase